MFIVQVVMTIVDDHLCWLCSIVWMVWLVKLHLFRWPWPLLTMLRSRLSCKRIFSGTRWLKKCIFQGFPFCWQYSWQPSIICSWHAHLIITTKQLERERLWIKHAFFQTFPKSGGGTFFIIIKHFQPSLLWCQLRYWDVGANRTLVSSFNYTALKPRRSQNWSRTPGCESPGFVWTLSTGGTGRRRWGQTPTYAW